MERQGDHVRDRVRELREVVAELRRVTNDRLDEANLEIAHADARIAELRIALASATSARDLGYARFDLELAVLSRDRYEILRKVGDMRWRLDRCDRELDELERRVG